MDRAAASRTHPEFIEHVFGSHAPHTPPSPPPSPIFRATPPSTPSTATATATTTTTTATTSTFPSSLPSPPPPPASLAPSALDAAAEWAHTSHLDPVTTATTATTVDRNPPTSTTTPTPSPPPPPKKILKENAVPASSLGRIWGFGSLAASLAGQVALGSAKRMWAGGEKKNPTSSSTNTRSNHDDDDDDANSDNEGRARDDQERASSASSSSTSTSDSSASASASASGKGTGSSSHGDGGHRRRPHHRELLIGDKGAEMLAEALCKMRGAALKLGQMLSIMDEESIPPQIHKALERVRNGADVMPIWQLQQVLSEDLGSDWRTKFASFDMTPIAAASIGQVHQAVLPNGEKVAVKVQYPGVADSIHSDIDNLMTLIRIANIFPKGLYVEQAVAVAKRELTLECDYEYEKNSQVRFRHLVQSCPDLQKEGGGIWVPQVYPDLCSKRVLTSEFVPGTPIDQVAHLTSTVRDSVGTRLLRLTLEELFHWRTMQTDPNWGNFLYDEVSDRLYLIDFGAAKEYPPSFVQEYMEMVRACAERDRQTVLDKSLSLGFLSGDEPPVMLKAHVESGFVVGEPFGHKDGPFDFGAHNRLTARVSQLGAVMLKHRQTPPPEEAYSLHRKLSGSFLACIKIKAKVPCRDLFYNVYERMRGAESSQDGERRGEGETERELARP